MTKEEIIKKWEEIRDARNKAVELLKYWVPNEMPLPHCYDPVSLEHQEKWSEAMEVIKTLEEK